MLQCVSHLFTSQDLCGNCLLTPSKMAHKTFFHNLENRSLLKAICMVALDLFTQLILSPITLIGCGIKLSAVPLLLCSNNSCKNQMLLAFDKGVRRMYATETATIYARKLPSLGPVLEEPDPIKYVIKAGNIEQIKSEARLVREACIKQFWNTSKKLHLVRQYYFTFNVIHKGDDANVTLSISTRYS